MRTALLWQVRILLVLAALRAALAIYLTWQQSRTFTREKFDAARWSATIDIALDVT